jgi:Ethylene-responsive protein kinase Le-CTR1
MAVSMCLMNTPPVQVLEQVQGQHAKGKKLRILFDDGENIGSDDIMRASYSGHRVRTDPSVLHFFKYGELTYKQALPSGFYAPFGDFPEVAEKDELPQLTELIERCSVLEGREVILIDPSLDNDLRAFLDGPVVEVASAAGESIMYRVQRLAVLVATRMGGAMTDGALGAQYSTYSQSLQHTQGSAVLLLGMLSVRTLPHSTCHWTVFALCGWATK